MMRLLLASLIAWRPAGALYVSYEKERLYAEGERYVP